MNSVILVLLTLLFVASASAGTQYISTQGANISIGNKSQLFIDNTNNYVGVGTMSPASAFEVVYPGNAYLTLTTNTSSNGAGLLFRSGGASTQIANFVAVNSSGVYRLTMGVAGNTTVALTNSNVGIGTQAPGATLHLVSTDSNGSLLVQNSTSATHLFVNGSTGYVGIGARTPTQTLHVNGTANITTAIYTPQLCLNGICQTTFGNITGVGTASYVSKWSNATHLTNSLIYDTGTQVIIGTTSGSGDFIVHDASGSASMAINAPQGSDSEIWFRDISAGTAFSLYRPANTRDFRIWTASAGDILSITQAGYTGIGTRNATAKFEINSTAANGSFRVGNDTETAIFVNGSTNYVGIGTTNPSYPLQVNSTTTTGLLYVGNGSTPALYVGGSRQDVGIGTTSLQGRLTISKTDIDPDTNAYAQYLTYVVSGTPTAGSEKTGVYASTAVTSNVGGAELPTMLVTGARVLTSYTGTINGTDGGGGSGVVMYGLRLDTSATATVVDPGDSLQVFSIRNMLSSNLGTVGTTEKVGIVSSATGTADTNYAGQFNTGEATTNYALYLTSATANASSYYIYTTGTVPFIARTDGYVGIGVKNPTALLHVNSSAANGSFFVQNTANVAHFFINGSSGAIGAGTAAPKEKVEIYGGYLYINAGASAINNGVQTVGGIKLGSDSNTTVPIIANWRGASSADQGIDIRTYNSGYVNAVRIVGNGNVGIGATPIAQLHVNGTGQTTADMNTAGNTGGAILLQDAGTSAGNGGAVMFAATNSTGTPKIFATIKGLVASTSNNGTGHLAFSTRNAGSEANVSERMRITSDGKVAIGTITPSYTLDVKTSAASSYVANFNNTGNNANRYGVQIVGGADDGSGQTYYLNFMDGDGTVVGYCQNNAGTFSCVDSSDARRKTNIVDTNVQGLSTLRGLRVVDFNRAQNPNGPRIHGFIAQEVQQVYPDAVSVGPDGMLGISKTEFVPLLIKAVQEQQNQIDQLQQGGNGNGQVVQEVATLNQQVLQLQAENTQLRTDIQQIQQQIALLGVPPTTTGGNTTNSAEPPVTPSPITQPPVQNNTNTTSNNGNGNSGNGNGNPNRVVANQGGDVIVVLG
jgi:hypothetical protein